MLGETVLFSIAGDLLLGVKASGAVPPSVLAGAARAEMETALRGQSWPVTRDDPIDGNAARHEHDKGENPCTLDSAKASSD